MKLDYFKMKEFMCPCGCKQNDMKKEFLEMIDLARYYSQIPYKLNSGFRCQDHNDSLSQSKKTSSHIKGYAADIHCVDSKSRALILGGLMEAGFTRIGIAKTFLHADCDPDKPMGVVWVYS